MATEDDQPYDVDHRRVEAARAIEQRLGFGPSERPATEDDEHVGGIRMVLDQELLRFGLPPEAGLTGLLRHLRLQGLSEDRALAERIRGLQRQFTELMSGVRAMVERGETVELMEAFRTIEARYADNFVAGSKEGFPRYDPPHKSPAAAAEDEMGESMKIVDDVGSIARSEQAAEDPAGYFARGREEVGAEIARSEYVTKSSKVLTDADIERLAAEAEKGHDD